MPRKVESGVNGLVLTLLGRLLVEKFGGEIITLKRLWLNFLSCLDIHRHLLLGFICLSQKRRLKTSMIYKIYSFISCETRRLKKFADLSLFG